MRRLIAVILPLLTPFFAAGQSDEVQILALEEKRNAAVLAHDTVYLASLYDDHYHGVIATGKLIDKKEMLRIVKSNNPHVLFSTDEVKACIYGNTAVVTGKLLSKSKNAGAVLGQTRFIHVYIRSDGGWKLLESQATVIH